MLHRGQQLSAATARTVLTITEWRLSARSAGSDDVLDDSQPSDRADQAATSRDGMSQLCMSLEGPPSWHVHHGNAHRLDTTCKCESPTTSLDICLASSRPLHTPLPPLPLPRLPCTSSNRDAQEQPEITPGWTQKEGRRPPGLPPLPPPQTSPHNPSTLCWQARARDGRAGGGGAVAKPRGWPTGVGPPYSSPGQSDPPRVQRCRCRLFRQRAVSASPSSTPPFIGIKVAGEAG